MATAPPLVEKLRQSSRELLDLSSRNRLISTPRTKTRSTRVEVVGAEADNVFRRLVRDHKSLTFIASASEVADDLDEDEDSYGLSQPDDETEGDSSGTRRRGSDGLQTRLTSDVLQRRLLRLYSDARTAEEEQGVNILFLAIGFLKWYESQSSEVARYAPLLLVPVKLERQSSRSQFKITALDEDITTNLSLKEKLLEEFHVKLPEVPDVDADELVSSEYLQSVQQAVAGQPRWEVLPNDMVLWFFSFTKFLMYRDLQVENWPEDGSIADKDSIARLLQNGFRAEPPLCGDDDPIDQALATEAAIHVVDADSSQTLAIEEARRGRNLVIQGPPGTGKSQTIANIIAAAVKDGKRVLFVAEKMAALEVVKSRMDRCGLGSMCFELHSNKANKKAVLADLAQTLEMRRPRLSDSAEQIAQFRLVRDRLNQHAQTLHGPFGSAKLTPFQVMGRMANLSGRGVPPPKFRLPHATEWSEPQINAKAALVNEVATHAARVGNPAQHPWRGVGLRVFLPNDRQRLVERLPAVLKRVEQILAATGQLAQLLNYKCFPSPQQISVVAKLGFHLAQAPAVDVTAIAEPAWDTQRQEIDNLVSQGEIYAAQAGKVAGRVEESAWSADVTAARKQVALRGKSWLRWLNRGYREACTVLESVCVERPPTDVADRLALLDDLIAGQKALKYLTDDEATGQLGRRAFGSQWKGVQSDWSSLKQVVEWVSVGYEKKLQSTFRLLLKAVQDAERCKRLVHQIGEHFKPLLNELTALFRELELDLAESFGQSDLNSVSLLAIRERLLQWIHETDSLEAWIAFRTRWSRLKAEQLEPLATVIAQGGLTPDELADHFLMATYDELIRAVFQRFPALAEFSGQSHEQMIETFCELDRCQLQLARQEVSMAHYRGIPKGDGDIGELSIIRREIEKQRRHLPIRQLIKRAGRAIQAIKPVFMMSPMSIAQFLEAGAVEFDLLLIDEASQVRPVDALGAVARCKQIVVVGDDKQMPPTSFFEKMAGSTDTDDEDEDGTRTGDLESVLGLCKSQNVTERMLRWHYRSRHHTLIAVSNKEFYGNKLYIVPSAQEKSAELGLQFRHVPDGVFDRGNSATNQVEARAVALAVIDHARRYPKLSLGVGAFSMAQRNAIIDELEILRRQSPDVEWFFSNASEPFFVKNLESLQGDERDVIYISVAYGRDASGYFGMGFGPLSISGGERRLNVLISRARERCVVFSSITAEDIDLNRARSRGAAVLKAFLKYAQDGIFDAGNATDREPDSDFELDVKRCVEEIGYQVDCQVGVAGFFVDLAVRDPEKPGRYLLGIECDGATYHSSRSARDRDRLRQQVLEDRGWTIHRVWSTDWFKNRSGQVKRVIEAVEAARIQAANPSPEPVDIAVEPVQVINFDLEEGENDEELSDDGNDQPLASAATPYEEANLHVSVDTPLNQLPSAALAQVVLDVVRVEGPVHRTEIARRIGSLWGHQRTTTRIIEAVERALVYAVNRGHVEGRGDFFVVAGQEEIKIRSREQVYSATLRNPDMLPPDEIRAAILRIVREHLGASNDEIIVVTGRLLGFRSTGSRVKEAISRELDDLLASGTLVQRDERVYAS